jgi:hypothetical protein
MVYHRQSIKYPGMAEGARAAGMKYVTVLQRVRDVGMSIADAISTPVGMRTGRKPQSPKEKRASAQHKADVKRVKRRALGLVERVVEDRAPPRIRTLRAEFCVEFMRGKVDQKVLAELKGYANERRADQC